MRGGLGVVVAGADGGLRSAVAVGGWRAAVAVGGGLRAVTAWFSNESSSSIYIFRDLFNIEISDTQQFIVRHV